MKVFCATCRLVLLPLYIPNKYFAQMSYLDKHLHHLHACAVYLRVFGFFLKVSKFLTLVKILCYVVSLKADNFLFCSCIRQFAVLFMVAAIGAMIFSFLSMRITPVPGKDILTC